MKKSEILFLKSASDLSVTDESSFLIYDSKLAKTAAGKKIVAKFKYKLGVAAGEKAKSVSSFEKVLSVLSKKWPTGTKQTPIYVLGGGSLGDLGGFIASVYKRGIPLIQIPTTWLSAVDSAHGGKTALNLNQLKNQIGSIYPAEKIILIEEIFIALPSRLLREAIGEIFKIALIDSEKLWLKVSTIKPASQIKLSKKVWAIMPQLIEAKWKIVLRDPYEKNQVRHILNFGHSLGHVVEANYKWPHGECVLYGLAFDMILSLRHGHMKESEFLKIVSSPLYRQLFESERYRQFLSLKKSHIEKGLAADKKVTPNGQIFQTLLARPGRVSLVKMPVQSLITEYTRQQKRAYASV